MSVKPETIGVFDFNFNHIFANPIITCKRKYLGKNYASEKNTSYPKEKVNVLFLENISDAAVKYFKDAGYSSVRKIGGALSQDELVKQIKDVHLLGIRSKTQITSRVLEAANKLQAIGCFCIGVNRWT